MPYRGSDKRPGPPLNRAIHTSPPSHHEKVDSYEHLKVCRILKGIFLETPFSRDTLRRGMCHRRQHILRPEGRITLSTWHTSVMLLALTSTSKSADLSQLDRRLRRYLPEGVTFQPTKQSRQSKPLAYFFPAFTANHQLCPVTTLCAYEDSTREYRREKGSNPLFLTSIRPHVVASSSTIAQWLKSTLEKAGLDTHILKAHSRSCHNGSL